jgi:hypothetical protein
MRLVTPIGLAPAVNGPRLHARRMGVTMPPVISRTGVLSSALLRLALLAPLHSTTAHAVDVFEIQVYDGAINDPRQAGIELHTNFVAAGREVPDFPGEAVPNHALRLTLEPSLGVLPFWELGAYFQVATSPGESQAHFGGGKLRSKLMVPRAHTGPFVLGLNMEVGRGVRVLGSSEWDSEVRPILGWGRGRWFVAVNPILGWALSGPTAAAPAFEPCAKVQLAVARQVGVGVEYYAGLGRVDALLPWSRQQQVVYLAGDLLDGPLELNVGVGRGLTDVTDAWTLKAIFGKAF